MDHILEIVKKLLTGSAFDTMSVFVPLTLGVISIFLTKHFKKENEDFSNPSLIQGEIVKITGSGNGRYPTIEYDKEGGKALFKSSLGTLHGQVGDIVDLEISKAGKMRLESKANMQYEKIMPFFTMLSFSLFALFLYVNFIK